MSAVLLLLTLTAAQSPYVLAIGVNQGGPELTTLSYADDDAAETVTLFHRDPNRFALHTVMDAETQGRYAELAELAQPPELDAIRRSVERLSHGIRADLQLGGKPTVLIWLSGHADYDDAGHAYFPLHRGRLDADALVEEIVAPLSEAHRVHLIVDTCFAGSLVRARAREQSVDPSRVQQAFWARGPLAFANVGVLVGATPGTRAYEWQEIRAGVFSALVRAGLRGAADSDGDARVRYTELEAFLAAATQGIEVAEARPRVRAFPPSIDRDAVLSEQGWLSDVAVLRGDLSKLGTVHVLDERGGWLLASRFEPGFKAQLWLPRGRRLYVRTGETERELIEEEGELRLSKPVARETRSRSLIGDALKRGLFATAYGPAFYQGFNAAVTSRASATAAESAPASSAPLGGAAWPIAGVAGGLAIVSGGLAGVAGYIFYNTQEQVPALQSFAAATLLGGVAAGATVVAIGAAGVALLGEDDESP